MELFLKHQELLEKAIKAVHDRTFFSQYPEHPSPKIYGESADEEGRKNFEQMLNRNFEELIVEKSTKWIGEEESPFLQEALGIKYPAFEITPIIENGKKAFHTWRKISPQERAGILIESLERIRSRFFEIAYATMHTTGQAYMMSFQASGPHAADRALEAIALGFEELQRFPQKTNWEKPMGKYTIQLQKEWKAVPKGLALAIGCSTFPTWNTVPGVYASLITGNPVIVKPHPGSILPIAIYVSEIQKVLKENGLNPFICQLAVDSTDQLITRELAEHPEIKIIDFTGNSEFGNYLENLKDKVVFTEKTGVNSVILDSVEDLDKALQNLAFSVSLYSGQMCTAPQNFFIPEEGVKTKEGLVPFDTVAQKFSEAINALADNPKLGPNILGSIQNKNTLNRISEAKSLGKKVWLDSKNIENPIFKSARTATPALIEVDSNNTESFSKEHFGPVALLIRTRNTDESIALAKEMAIKSGAISCGAYTTAPQIKEKIADEMSLAATPVSFNFTGGVYLNQNASFSDFHVSGGNPAGNASFTDPAYVVKRFTWVGIREPASV
ncbi:phenylacetic acid degradation protein PaaN [soil metagenome]